MTFSRRVRLLLVGFLVVALAGIYVPLGLVILNSFNADQTFSWPPPGFTLDWWSRALDNQGAKDALVTSVKVGLIATTIALVLGTMVAFAVGRHRFFGRESISFVILLPIALRRSSTSLEEASSDLGATTLQTFRFVTLPMVRTALLAGALLAFGLSFDEIIVTTFTAGAGTQTLPLWMLDNLARPNQAPIVNVVAAIVLVLSVIPIYLSQRFAGDSSGGGRV